MKLWVISDLHKELQRVRPLLIPEADVCIVAGDLTSPVERGIEWLAGHVSPYMAVIYVAGNHEFYGDCVPDALGRAKGLRNQFPGVTFMEQDEVEFGGGRFLGCTLWTDYAIGIRSMPESVQEHIRDLGPDHPNAELEVAWAMRDAEQLLTDHRAILFSAGGGGVIPKLWKARHARLYHHKSRNWLAARFREPGHSRRRTVVVTHHAPHPNSISPGFEGSISNPCFVSDLEKEILDWRPGLWIHGHVHSSHDYLVGDTRIVCNPLGYGGENPAFEPGLVIDV